MLSECRNQLAEIRIVQLCRHAVAFSSDVICGNRNNCGCLLALVLDCNQCTRARGALGGKAPFTEHNRKRDDHSHKAHQAAHNATQ